MKDLNLKKLKDAYQKAIKDNLKEFKFQGHTFLVDYIKYYLEYCELN